MKFLCERCKTKYSIGDERVRGKILKIRCKNCSNIVTVRDLEASRDPALSSRPGAQTPTAGKPVERAIEGAMAGKAGRAESSAPGGVRVGEFRPEAMVADDEWYLAVDDRQQGPIPFADLIAKIERGEAKHDCYIWRDGLEDWVRADEVPELRPHFRKRHNTGGLQGRIDAAKPKASQPAMPAVPAALPPPPMPPASPAASAGGGVRADRSGRIATAGKAERVSAPSSSPAPERAGRKDFRELKDLAEGGKKGKEPAAPAKESPANASRGAQSPLFPSVEAAAGKGGDGDFSFDIEEPSRIVKLDAIAPMGKKSGTEGTAGKVFALPGMGEGDVAAKAAAMASGASTPFPRPATAPAMAAARIPSQTFIPSSPSPAHSHYRLLALVLGLVTSMLVALVFYLLSRGETRTVIVEKEKSPEEIGAEIVEQLVREDAKKKAMGLLPRPDDDVVPAARTGMPPRRATRAGPHNKNEARPAAATVKNDRLGELYADTSKTSSNPELHAPARPLDDSINLFKNSAKLCYERALKRDPSLAQARKIDVNFQTAGGGVVSSIDITSPYKDQFIGICLAGAIKRLHWQADTPYQFPLFLRGS